LFFNKKCQIGTPAENNLSFEEGADALRDAAVMLLPRHKRRFPLECPAFWRWKSVVEVGNAG
jgi:hypothetical protein